VCTFVYSITEFQINTLYTYRYSFTDEWIEYIRVGCGATLQQQLYIRIGFSETIIKQIKDSVVIYLYLISCRDVYSKTLNHTGTHHHVIKTNKSISLNYLKLQRFFYIELYLFTSTYYCIV